MPLMVTYKAFMIASEELKIELAQQVECGGIQPQRFLFLQEISYFISGLGTLYLHMKSYQAAFYACKISLFPITSFLARIQITPYFLYAEEIADIIPTLWEIETYHGTQITLVIQLGFEVVIMRHNSVKRSSYLYQVYQLYLVSQWTPNPPLSIGNLVPNSISLTVKAKQRFGPAHKALLGRSRRKL